MGTFVCELLTKVASFNTNEAPLIFASVVFTITLPSVISERVWVWTDSAKSVASDAAAVPLSDMSERVWVWTASAKSVVSDAAAVPLSAMSERVWVCAVGSRSSDKRVSLPLTTSPAAALPTVATSRPAALPESVIWDSVWLCVVGGLASLRRESVVSIRVASEISALTDDNVPAWMALLASVPWAAVAKSVEAEAAAVPASVISDKTCV